MSRFVTIVVSVLAAVLPVALPAACNPEVVPAECTATEAEECDGVTPPSASGISASISCDRITFRIDNVTSGREESVKICRWSGSGDCPQPELVRKLPSTELKPDISWVITAGGVRVSGTGETAGIARPSGVCSASCTFTLKVHPSRCPAPAPVTYTETAVFENAVSVSGGGRRVCTTSSSHSAHVFGYSASCVSNLSASVSGSAVKVSDDGGVVVVRGTSSGGAALTVSADCGSDSVSFDVVELDRLTLHGCGCINGNDPAFETMAGKGEVTASLTTRPARYSGETHTTVTAASTNGTAHGWFDCELDGIEAADEPKTNRTYEVVRLGKIEPVDDDCKGNTNKQGGARLVIGRIYELVEVGGRHLKGAATLEIVDLKPKRKMERGSKINKPVLSGGNGSWTLALDKANIVPGTLTLRLRDSAHKCLSRDFPFEIVDCACECSTCDQFGKLSAKEGCIELRFGLGRSTNGRPLFPLSATLMRTDALPDFTSRIVPEGRVDVSTTNEIMMIVFRRNGVAEPVASYRLTPGANVFFADEYRDGVHLSRIRWTVSGGVWTMESLDPSDGFAAIASESLAVVTNGATVVERRTRGGTVSETRWRDFPGIGSFAFEETVGSGAEAMTTYRTPVTSGPASGALLSEVRPDGSWILNSYDAEGRLASVTTPFGDTAPMLDDSHAVIGYNAHVRKIVYGYVPVDPRDDGSCHPRDPRMTSEYVGSDADGWVLVSRAWETQFVTGNERYDIVERAASVEASYGDAANPRTVSCYHWRNADAGELKWRVGEDGLKTTCIYELDGLARTTTSMTAPESGAIPLRTTIAKSFANAKGDIVREETWLVTEVGTELLSWTAYVRDVAGREIRRETSGGEIAERAYACCGPEWTRDERGIVTDYIYDSAGREIVTQRGTVQTETRYDLAGRVSETVRRGVGTGLALASSNGYDTAGRLAWSVGEDGVRTEYAYSISPEGGEVRTTVRAAGTNCAMTNTVVSFRDGTVKATYLNGVLKTTETREPFAETDYEGSRGVSSPRWKRTESDFLGRTVSESRPGFGGSTLVTFNAYDVAGRIIATRSYSIGSGSSPLAFASYGYDVLGENSITVSDRNFNGVTDWTGPDLIQSNAVRYVKLDNAWWRESRRWSIHRDGSAEPQLVATSRTRVTGLGEASECGTLAAESVSIDLRGNATTNRTYRNRAAAEEIAWARYPTSSTFAVAVSTNGLVRSSTSQTGVTTTFGYDALERETSVTDGRGKTTRTVYDAQNRISSTIDALGYSTAYGYDALGRQVSVTDPLTNTVVTAYDAEGRVISQRGATYPVDYAYDEYGNKISMTTYRDESLVQGDTTRWLYDEPSGCMTNKVYADGKGPTYTYTPDGKLACRTLARGIVTTYSYNANGVLTNTVYSDGTPSVSLVYNRAGRQIRAVDAAGVTTFAYDQYGANTNETVVGVAGTNTIERFYDSFGRDAGYALNGVRQSTLSYDAATGRLASMQIPSIEESNHLSPTPTLNSNFFTWNYLDGSDLKSSLTYPNGLTASWTYGNRSELLEVNNASPTGTISRYVYTYDAAGRRIGCDKSGSAFTTPDTNSYLYNARSELTNATAAVDSAYRYSYDFDDIGNRNTSSERGVESAEYTANNLNQYTDITSQTSQTSQTFQTSYDADGNQTLVKTATGIWKVEYNGENRPVRWTQGDTVIMMSFDRMGRRVTKNDQRFVYNGYLQVANFHLSSTNYHLFAWDPTEPVATRPLVWTKNDISSYYAFDGNKNVSEVIASDGTVSAHYEYAPFGALTVSRGESAAANPWRFSSEYAEDDTATVYYNYRHYEPVMGRWSNREEFSIDSLNPYMQLGNHSIWTSDRLGLYDELFHFYLMYLIMNDMFGAPDSDASNLAFAYAQGSQMPDSGMFDAMREKVSPTETTLRIRRLYHNLNSLTCCQLKGFQDCLKKKIQEEQDPFLKGVYLHTFADTFAHVELVGVKDGEPCSYGDRWGHAKDLTLPDDIRYENSFGEEIGKERFWNLVGQLEVMFGRELSGDLKQFLESLYERTPWIISSGGSGSVWSGGVGFIYKGSKYRYSKSEIERMIKDLAREKGLKDENWKWPLGKNTRDRIEKVYLIREKVEPNLAECLEGAMKSE